MATLLNKVSKSLQKDQSGNLSQTVTPTQTLAQQAGLPAAPITPGGVAAVGGNSDQAKMAGTTPQKQVALKQSTDSVNTLQEAGADKKARTEKTADEQDLATRTMEAKKAFGETQVRVAQFVTAAGQNTANSAQTATLTAPTEFKPSGTATQTDVNDAFSALTALEAQVRQKKLDVTDPKYQNAYNKLRTVLGYTNLDASAEAVQAMNLAVSTAATKQVESEGTKSAATSMVNIEDAGVAALLPKLLPDVAPEQQVSEMARILGRTEDEVKGMTIAQLNQAVSVMEEQAGRSTEDIARNMDTANSVDRQELAGQAQDLAASGAEASQVELESLGKALENADTIEIDGQPMALDKVLDDEFLVGKMKEYLTAAPGSDIRKKMEADPTLKGLVQFMNGYSKVLTEAVSGLESAGKTNVDIQETNQKIGTFGTQKLPDAIMNKIYPNWGKLADAKYKPDKLVMGINGLPANMREDVVQTISTIVADPKMSELTGQLAELVAKIDMQKLFGGAKGTRMIDKLVDNVRQRQNIDAHEGNIDFMITNYFSGNLGQKDLSGFIEQETNRNLLGLPTNSLTSSLLDTDHDGKLDSDFTSRAYKALKSDIEDADSVSDVIKGGTVNAKQTLDITGITPGLQDVLTQLGPSNIKKKGLTSAVTESLRFPTTVPTLDFTGDAWAGGKQPKVGELALNLKGPDTQRILYENFKSIPDIKYLTELKELPAYKKDATLRAKVDTAIRARNWIIAIDEGKKPDVNWTGGLVEQLRVNGLLNVKMDAGGPVVNPNAPKIMDAEVPQGKFVPGRN